MTLSLAVIPGDGTGPEVVREARKVLDAAADSFKFTIDATEYSFGGQRYLQTGHILDDGDLDQLRRHDAIFLGAVGHPDVKPGVLERGLLLKMRFDLDQYVNLRPVRLYPGVETPLADKSPDEIDFVVVRENTEDLYCGNGGLTRRGTPQEISTQEMIATAFGVERCVRYAFQTAANRKRRGKPGKLTLVHKTNVLTYCGETWRRLFEEVGEADYPDIEREYHHVDACCMYLVTRPEAYDVIVTPNMFGDILTDLGAALAGGMGIAASGNLCPNISSGARGGPSMFEPVHGSSPDIAGQDKANPLAAIDAAGMLLREIGRGWARKAGKQENAKAGNAKADEGRRMEAAGEAVAAAVQRVTPKFAGKRLDRSGYSTTEIGDMAVAALK